MPSFNNPISLAAAGFFGLTGAAFSGEIYTPPAGCEAFVTVQTQACTTTIYWQCSDAPDGQKWTAHFNIDGLQSIVSYDKQYRWTEAHYTWDSSDEAPTGTPSDPISLAMLMLLGTDSYEYDSTITDAHGTRILHTIGRDDLTGDSISIDGQTLQEVTYDMHMTEADGSTFYQSHGIQYFSRGLGIFITGTDFVTDNGVTTEYQESPVSFLFPGDAGFADPTPVFGCDAPAPAPTPAPQPMPQPAPQPAPVQTGPVQTGPGANNNK